MKMCKLTVLKCDGCVGLMEIGLAFNDWVTNYQGD